MIIEKKKLLIVGLVILWTIAILRMTLPALLNTIGEALIRSEPVVRADLIIALGGDRYCLREKKAAEIYLEGYAKRIIVSGVQYIPGIHTGDWARNYVVGLGVKEADVIVLRETWNTREEAKRLTRLMRENGWSSALVVTSPYHSRRALYTLEKAAPELRFTSVPVDPRHPEWRPEKWWTRRMDAGMTVREILAWINTLLRGWE
jgi:uncharacterized SAM-binding protein YcdF (DUF218 family)